MTHKPATMKAWIRQPLSLLCRDGGLTKPAAIVLAIIIDRATDTDPPQPVQVDIAAIAWSSGYSERTVRRALSDLVARDLLSSTRTGRGNVYALTGAVAVLPPKGADTAAPAAAAPPQHGSPRHRRSSSRAQAQSAAEAAEMEEYLSLVNRFAPDPAPPELVEADLGVCSEPAPADPAEY